jgi:outer membrane cobalamin receptor
MVFRLSYLLFPAMTLLAADTVSVRVQDPSQAPVAGVEVEAYCRAGTDRARTGEDGVARVRCEGPGRVRVRATGFETAEEEVCATMEKLDVRLRLAVMRTSVEVTVTDAGERTVVAGSGLEIDKTAARTVLDAVERLVPSAYVTRRGALGYGIATNGTGTISIRGVGGSPNTGTLVVIDGRPDFQGLMGHPLPDLYSLTDAARVKVTQGPASVEYGSNAMGGVVEIEPRRPSSPHEIALTTSLGSFWTGAHRLALGGLLKHGFYHATAGVAHTSGDRPSSRFRDQDGTVAAGLDLNEHWKMSLQARYGFFHVEDPGPVTAPLNNSYARVGRGGYAVDLDNAYTSAYGMLRVYGSNGRHYITDGFRSTDSNAGFRAMETVLASPGLQLDLGGDFQHYGGAARNVTQRIDYGEHTLSEGAGFGRAAWRVTRPLKLNAGLRVHDHSRYGTLAVPEVGATWRVKEGWAVSAQVARGFRNPTIRELYLFPAPNPNLKPERMWNTQVTLDARPTRAVEAWVTGYYASLSDQIATMGRYPNLQLLNTGQALNRGIDAGARWRASRGVAFTAGSAYVRSTNLALLVPARKQNVGVDYARGRWSASAGAIVVGPRWRDTSHSGKLGGYTDTHARVSYSLGETTTVFVLVDNLLNRRFEVLPGYPMPGATASAGLSVSWR